MRAIFEDGGLKIQFEIAEFGRNSVSLQDMEIRTIEILTPTDSLQSISHSPSHGCGCSACCSSFASAAIVPSASEGATVVADYTSLLTSASMSTGPGIGAFFSFSLATQIPDYVLATLNEDQIASFRQFTAEQAALIRQAIAEFTDASGLTAFEVPSGQGDMNFYVFDLALFDSLGGGAAGFAYGPTIYDGNIYSDVFLDDTAAGGYAIILHEIGHAVGLKHPFDGNPILDPDLDNRANTVMSYNHAGFADQLGPFDIDAIQYLYGDETADGNQVASWSWDASTYTLTQTGFGGADHIAGIGGQDIIAGLAGDDVIYGRIGNDILDGGDGNDYLYGGDNDDELYGGNGNDTLNSGDGDDWLDGGNGNDWLQIGDYWDRSIGGINTAYGGIGSDGFQVYSGDNTLFGGADNDTFYLYGGSNRVHGGDGNDYVTFSYSGDGTAQEFHGGAGSDIFWLELLTTVEFIVEVKDLSAFGFVVDGFETISFRGSDSSETLIDDIANSGGSHSLYGGDDTIFTAGWNFNPWAGVAPSFWSHTYFGGAGDDEFHLGASSGYLYGEAGADLYIYDHEGDTSTASYWYVVDFETGLDQLDISAFPVWNLSIDINGYVSGITAAGNFGFYAPSGIVLADIVQQSGVGVYFAGNYYSELVQGGAAKDFLKGSEGNDEIYGNAGDDVVHGDDLFIASPQYYGNSDLIYGGDGNDRLFGALGDDVIYGEAGGDILNGGLGDDYLDGGSGNDTASYSGATSAVRINLQKAGVQNTLGDGRDNLVSIENLVGSQHGDILVGNGQANRIEGLEGDDRIYGYGGRDTLVLDGGNDRAWGGDEDDRLYGRTGNDRLYGDAGNDRLFGEDGDDRLIGGAGDDEMRGGTGGDIYFVDDAGDTVIELAGEGTDRVVAGIDYVLGDHMEVLRMRTGDLDGTGNALDNLLRGVGGANVLDGMAGNDDIYGGTGNDTLVGGAGDDRLYGEVGTDSMTGGTGLDFFIFQNAGELGDRVAIADRITDFSQADGDRMNVRGIDANTNTGGDQNFAFIGTGAFTGTAGQLRYFQTSTSTVVEMDVDGDGTGDLYIRLDGQIDLTAGDFVL